MLCYVIIHTQPFVMLFEEQEKKNNEAKQPEKTI